MVSSFKYIIGSTTKIAVGFFTGTVPLVINGMVDDATIIANGIQIFNPDTTMPPLPNMTVNSTAFENQTYADKVTNGTLSPNRVCHKVLLRIALHIGTTSTSRIMK